MTSPATCRTLRRKQRPKYGGDRECVALEAAQPVAPDLRHDLVALDAALTRLSAEDPQAAKLVELRHCTGLMKTASYCPEFATALRQRFVARWSAYPALKGLNRTAQGNALGKGALKGLNRTAQGNALGKGALKGLNRTAQGNALGQLGSPLISSSTTSLTDLLHASARRTWTWSGIPPMVRAGHCIPFRIPAM